MGWKKSAAIELTKATPGAPADTPLPACVRRRLPQAMESAAQRGKLRKPGAPGAGTAVGAEDILFLVRKVGRRFVRLFCRVLFAALGQSQCVCSHAMGQPPCQAMCMDLLPPCHSSPGPLPLSPYHKQDPKKYARAKELLIMDEEIRRARQLVEDVEGGVAGAAAADK